MSSLRVFLSSTFEDLKAHRQAVHEAVLGLELHADDMVLWAADDRSGTVTSLDRVRQADVVVLLVAHRYGYRSEGSEHSITELEYRTARVTGIPVLAFFLDPSVPWPPDHVEWEARDRLQAFKQRVEQEVTRKLFRTPEELATQVTQALAAFVARRRESPAARRPFEGLLPDAATPSRLLVEPDVLVEVGLAEDGLPLLLDVHRSRDLSGPLWQLEQALGPTGRSSRTALLDTFRQTLEQHATAGWGREQIWPVRMTTGEARDLWVSPWVLSGPFRSALAGLLGQRPPTVAAPSWRAAQGSVQGSLAHDMQLPSSGGENRYLGVDPTSGGVYSVGRVGHDWVEWRPFVFENVARLVPEAVFALDVGQESRQCPAADAPAAAVEWLAGAARDPSGRFGADAQVVVPRAAVLSLVATIAGELSSLHGVGAVHGDLKPHNVLLGADGVMLIDAFDVRLGEPAPGWTPDWSAPEQVLGLPLTPAADVYPLARMVAEALHGQLVGELRHYQTPRRLAGFGRYEMIHDPSLFIDDSASPMPPPAKRAWRDFVEGALRFNADRRRPATAEEFALHLRQLVADHPVGGLLSFRPAGALAAARLVDGTIAVCRVVGGPLGQVPPMAAAPARMAEFAPPVAPPQAPPGWSTRSL